MEHNCDLNGVMRAIGTLEGVVQEGFKGVHQRQDVTNGRLNKHDTRLASLEETRSESKGEKKAFNWVGNLVSGIIGLAAGLIGSLIQAGKI